MITKIFHAYTNEPGFFVHAINLIYGGLRCADGTRHRITSSQIENTSGDDLSSLKRFCLIIPVRRGVLDSIDRILSTTVVKAICDKRCILAFDFTNEAGSLSLRDKLTDLVSKIGIKEVENCWLLCQNRLIPQREAGKISVAFFDFFVLSGIHAANQLKTSETIAALAESYLDKTKLYSVLCLNGTPRIHRIRTVLELINQGLVSIEGLRQCKDRVVPYISLGRLDYVKGSLTADEVRNALRIKGQTQPQFNLDMLLDALPLKADSFAEEGNQLVSKIDIRHYTQTNISVVTETSMGEGCVRITEKTAKPLALGHPFVVIGPMHSVRIARSLGFSVFDEFIDHSYDTVSDPRERLKIAITAASRFLRKLQEQKCNLEELAGQVRHNVYFAKYAFNELYWDQYVRPIIYSLGIAEAL